jgi:hypothetical protein
LRQARQDHYDRPDAPFSAAIILSISRRIHIEPASMLKVSEAVAARVLVAARLLLGFENEFVLAEGTLATPSRSSCVRALVVQCVVACEEAQSTGGSCRL